MKKNILYLLLICFCLTACGTKKKTEPQTQSAQIKSAELSVSIPEAAEAGLFWAGVDKKTFFWTPKESTAQQMISWENAKSSSVDFSTGGKIRFEGTAADGLILVEGYREIESWDQSIEGMKELSIQVFRLPAEES